MAIMIHPDAGGGGGLTWSVITTSTAAVKDNGYIIDASIGAITLTLPTTPDEGDSVGIKSIDSSNTITIARNGSKIEGDEEDLVWNVAKSGAILVYSTAAYGWTIVTEINGGAGSTVEWLTLVGA